MESIKKVSYPCRIHGTVYLEDHPRTCEWLRTKKYLCLQTFTSPVFFITPKKNWWKMTINFLGFACSVLGKGKHIFSQMVDVHGDESHGRIRRKHQKKHIQTQDSKELPSGKLTYCSWNFPMLHRKYIDSISRVHDFQPAMLSFPSCFHPNFAALRKKIHPRSLT